MGAADAVGRAEAARIPGSLGPPPILIANKLWILAQRAAAAAARVSQYAMSPGQALAIGVLGLSAVAAFGLAPDTTLDATVKRTVVRALALPATSRASDGADLFWREERVLRGDTIGSLLARATVDDPPDARIAAAE